MRVVHSLEEPLDILLTCNDARKSEHLERRIVRMHAHVHAALLANWHDRLQEITHVLAQLFLGDAVVQ